MRKAALVAGIQVNTVGVSIDEEESMDVRWETIVARTNFVQEWAREANKDKQE